MPGPG